MQPVLLSQLSSVQAFLSSQSKAVAVHAPPLHTSSLVQALPSLQALSASVELQPLAKSQPSKVQALPSSQATVTPVQRPKAQPSPLVQALPSSHPAAFALCSQPVAGMHASSVHGFLSSQLTGIPVQLLEAHVSPEVQALPSSQASLVDSWLQLPVLLSQLSVVQAFLSSQSVGVPAQAPATQPSDLVHKLPSSQAMPSSLAVTAHLPVSATHAAVLHAPASAHTTACALNSQVFPPTHCQTPLHRSGLLPSAVQP